VVILHRFEEQFGRRAPSSEAGRAVPSPKLAAPALSPCAAVLLPIRVTEKHTAEKLHAPRKAGTLRKWSPQAPVASERILRRLFLQRFVDRGEVGHRDDSKQRLIRASILRN
jgi:hypothetical protein